MLLWQARMGLFKVLIRRLTGALVVRVCHTIQPVFDDPNLIAFGGLPAVMRIAEQAGLHDLVAQYLTVPGTAGSNATIKVAALVAGMVAGADSISDMDVLRHGGMGRMFDGLRAAITLGTHLRGYRFGHVRQLDAVASRLLVNLECRVFFGLVICWFLRLRNGFGTIPVRLHSGSGIPTPSGAVSDCNAVRSIEQYL